MILALLGGALIGLSASLFWSLNGRVAGVSGLVSGALSGAGEARRVRVFFLLGLLVAGLAFARLSAQITLPSLPLLPLAVAGLLVGAGTRLGGGCTSGHGVCGVSRFSLRSLVATVTFVATGALTVFVMRHVLELRGRVVKALLSALGAGLIFGVGLCVSGMTNPQNIQAFLDFSGHWSPNLLGVMAGAIAVHASWLRFGARAGTRTTSLPPRPRIDAALVGGAALFGVGWGLAGYCPGPSIVALGTGAAAPIVFVAAMMIGMRLIDALRAPIKDPQADSRTGASTTQS